MMRHRTLAQVLALAVLVPALAAGLALWSVGDQVEGVDTLPAAVVNHDEPVEVEVDGEQQPIAMGRLLAGGLTAPRSDEQRRLGWELATPEDAREGLEEGRYHAVLTIPSGFSGSLAGITRNEPEQAGVRVRTNDSAGALLGPLTEDIGDVAANDVGRMLTVTYLEGLYDQTAQMQVQLGRAADGAGRVAGGASDLAGGADDLADGTARAGEGAGDLADGTGQLSAGAGDLADGTDQLQDGAHELARGADRLAAGNRRTARGADRLAGGLGRMERQVAPLPGRADQLADGAQQLATGVSQAVGPLQEALAPLQDVESRLQQWREACPGVLREVIPDEAEPDVPVEEVCTRLGQRLDERLGTGDLAGLVVLAGQLDQLPQGAQELADGTRELADATPGLVQGVREARGGADQLADGNRRLARGADQLATGASGLAGGVDELGTGADQLAGGAAAASTGASELADGLGRLQDGAGQLAGGADQLRAGSGELAEQLRRGADRVPAKPEDERRADAEAVAQPVTSENGRFAPASATEALAPAALALALWLGAFVAYLVRPALARERLARATSATRVALAGWLPGVLLAALQAALLLPVLWLLGAEVVRPLALVLLVLPVAALSFVAIVQALVAALGARRGWVAVAVLGLVQVLTTTGLLPVDSAPGAVRALHDVLPVPVVADLARWAVLGTPTGVVTGVLLLLVWAGLGWGLTVLAARHRSRVRLADLRRTVATT